MPFRGTRWPHLAEGGLKAGPTRKFQLNGYLISSACFESTHAAPLAQSTRVKTTKDIRPSALTRMPTIAQHHEEPNVDPDSLRKTLEAHRESNRASLIVKIAGRGSARQPIQIPSLVKLREQSVESPLRAGVRHLKLGSSHKRNTRPVRRRARHETRGATVQPPAEDILVQWAPTTELRYIEKYPWMKHLKPNDQTVRNGRLTAREQLSREIDAFYSYAQATPREKKAAEQALQDISIAIRTIDRNVKIDVVGSRATGLDLPMSDIDLNVSTSSSSSNDRTTKALLLKLARHLLVVGRHNGPFRAVRTRFHPKIPLVVGRHAHTHLEFQVQSSVDVFLSMQQTISFVNEFPTLRKLFVLLRQILTMRGLDKGDEQGLSSYPLLVMIVAALKFSEGKLGRRDSGAHLLFFLDMYSDIDFITTAISFSPLQYIVKRHPHSSTLPHVSSAAPAPDSVTPDESDTGLDALGMDARRRFATIKPDADFLMCLQDPANLQNDLGKAAYRIREVQATFIRIREELKAGLTTWDDGEVKDTRYPLLAPCVGGDYRIHEHMRHDLEASVKSHDGGLVTRRVSHVQ